MKTNDIQIRDPFIVPVQEEGFYYLFGTTDVTCWGGKPVGFDCYRSKDLNAWEGPFKAFRPSPGFWATRNFWAPEVHLYNGMYYMFATFKAENAYRGTQILSSDSVIGPYTPLTEKPVTPENWECLDGTLYVDKDGNPWMVFCHEWTQVSNGTICAIPLSSDLKERTGQPIFLFSASEAPWAKARGEWSSGSPHSFPTYVTDGPFLHRLSNGTLVMLWSSIGDQGYAMGLARSQTGEITGPWEQEQDPVWKKDGGHGMVFSTFDGELMITFHSPNSSPDERPVFIPVKDTGTSLSPLSTT